MRGYEYARAWRGESRNRNEARLRGHIVAAEKIHAVEFVSGDQTLDLVEHRQRIEWAEPGLEAVSREPDGMAVGLAGLRAARLAEIGVDAGLAEGNQGA